MKKFIAILLSAVFCFLFCACNGNSESVTTSGEEISTEGENLTDAPEESDGIFIQGDPLSDENLTSLRDHGLFTESYFTNNVLFLTGGNDNYRIPTIVITNNGTLVAICNDRVYTVEDAAKVKYLTIRRSTDGGLTWTKAKNIASVDYYSQDIGSAVYDKEKGKIVLVFCRGASDPRAVAGASSGWHTLTSYDNGETWTEKHISVGGNEYSLRGAPYGAGPGIQLTEGKYKGRLVMGARVTATAANGISAGSYNTVIYSDDHGESWQTGGLVQFNTCECDVCEMPGGVIYLNSRSLGDAGKRPIAYSYDGGKTFTDFGYANDITEPISGCSGSVIRVENPYEKGKYITLFSNLNNYNAKIKNYDTNRRKISVWLSYDDGETWPVCKTIFKYQSAYSALQYDEVTGLFYILYESGSELGANGFRAYSRGINVATFSLAWLLSDENSDDTPISLVKTMNTWYYKASDKFASGNGSAEKPYVITTAEELAYLSKLVDMGYTMDGIFFELGADINLQGAEWYPIGNAILTHKTDLDAFVNNTPFSGHFDGKGYTVNQMNVNLISDRAIGLFGYVVGGEIKNVYMTGNVTSADRSSAIVGAIGDINGTQSVVTNCFFNGKITYIEKEEQTRVQGVVRVEYKTGVNDPFADSPDLTVFGDKVKDNYKNLEIIVAK